MTYINRVVNTFRSLFPKKGGFFLTLRKFHQIKESISKNIEILTNLAHGRPTSKVLKSNSCSPVNILGKTLKYC